MLVGMDSKASHAKGKSRVTLTIAPCLFAAFRAWMGDVQCVPLCECARVRAPFSLPFVRFKQTCSDDVRPQVRMGDATDTPLSFGLFVIIRIASFCKITMSALPFPSLHAPKPALHSPLQPTKGK